MKRWTPDDIALLILAGCLGLSILLVVVAVLAVVLGG